MPEAVLDEALKTHYKIISCHEAAAAAAAAAPKCSLTLKHSTEWE
jgi:hypothetical protein